MESESDAILMGRIIEGDSDAARILIARHGRRLERFLSRVAPRNAEDVYQETWMRVVRSAGRYDPSSPFPPWLFRIAWNRVRDHWRAGANEEAGLAALGRERPVDTHEDPAVANERTDRIRALVAELPPAMAEAVALRYFEELNESEMAARTGLARGTIKSRLHHALRRLAVAAEKEGL